MSAVRSDFSVTIFYIKIHIFNIFFDTTVKYLFVQRNWWKKVENYISSERHNFQFIHELHTLRHKIICIGAVHKLCQPKVGGF